MKDVDKRSHMVKEYEMLLADMRSLNPKTSSWMKAKKKSDELHAILYGN